MTLLQNHLSAVFLRLTQARRAALMALIVSIAFAAQLILIQSAWAATIPVNTATDEFGTGANCSLREAVRAASTDTAFGGCVTGSGADTLSLPAGTYVLTGTNGNDTNVSGDIDITSTLTISGSGATSTIIRSSVSDRVLHVISGIVAMTGISVTNGSLNNADGGGILVNSGASLNLIDAVVSGNTVTGAGNVGGGIANNGTITVTNSQIQNNIALDGGGIAQLAGTLVLTNSAVISNSASNGNGGGIDSSGTATIINTTFVSNTATSDGGGIYANGGTLNLRNNTVFSNTAVGNGGGIRRPGGGGAATVNISNTLVISNAAGTGPNCNGTISNGSNNIEFPLNNCATGFTTLNARVAPLGNFGGPTLSMPLLPGSPAINAGNAAICPATDQRGVARPQLGTCDIGAFESRGFAIVLNSGDGQSTAISTTFAAPLAVTVTNAFGEPVGPGGIISLTGPGSGAGITPTAATTATTNATGAVSKTVTANGTIGSYAVVVTTTGATASASFSLTNTDVAIAGLSAINNSPKTVSTTVNLTASISAGTNVTYAWSLGDGSTGTGITRTRAYAAASVYTAVVTATNSAGSVVATTLVTITDVPISGLSAINNSPTPLGNSTAFTASAAVGTAVTYTWNFGDGSTTVSGATATHTYAAAGNYTALVTATNSANSLSRTTPVTITNLAPIANAGPDQSVGVNTTVALSGTASTDPDGHTPLTYGWAQTGGSAVTLSSNTAAQPTFTAPAAPTVLTFTLTVTDSQGLPDATPDEVVINVGDGAIVGLSASNSSPTRLTDSTSLTASITSGSNVAYTWNFGDGNPTVSGATQSHTYAAAGSYTAIVTATNGSGSVSTTTSVSVTNAAPVANAGADQSVSVNANVSLTGTASADPDTHTPLTYGWAQTGGPAVTLSGANTGLASFTAPGSPTVLTFTLTVTDAQGLADATPDEVIITVGDVAIAGLDAQNSSPTRLDDATSFTATTTAGTGIVYTWNFGDDSATSNGATQSHTYAAAGSYTALVTATNGLGSASKTTPVTVTNAAPTANAGLDINALVGASVTLTGDGLDLDNHTPLSYLWQQTGSPAVTLSNANTVIASFTAPATPVVLTFTLRVTDSKGLADATPDEMTVTVNDIAISGLTAQNSSPTALGNATNLTASISAGTNVLYTWNFGDGSATSSGATQSHTYALAGSYTAVVTATNGVSSTSASTAVSIGCAPGTVVLNTSDNSCGSLRQVVAGAPANTTVTFTPSLAGQVILLTSGEIQINKDLTIDAVDAPGVRVSSNYNSRIFYTDSGTNLSLKNLTLSNARNSGDGGAIIAYGAISLTNTSVFSSLVDNGNGGAIFAVGPLYISGGVFQNNRADLGSGGAIASNAAVLTGTQVISNVANNNGGGVLALGALSIQASVVQSNTAGGSGGGMNTASSLAMTDTSVLGNRANGAGGGGGLRANGSSVLMGGVVRDNDTNGPGGGLRLAAFVMTNTQVLGNTGLNGGGLSYFTSAHMTNVLLARNSASGNGEAIFADASGVGMILNTTIASPTANAGAAIYVNTGSVFITNTIVTSHSMGMENNFGTVGQGYNLFFGNAANLSGTIISNGGSVVAPCNDPRFVNPAADNYRLSNGSAAINAGTNAGVSADFEGDGRPIGSSTDIGYDETNATDVGVCGLAATNSSPTRLDDATSFTATITSGSNATYTWNFGDGSATASGATTTYVYTAAGTYTAIVTATNSAGSLSVTTLVTITNLAPVANAGPDQSATVSASVTLSSTSSDPDNHTPLSYSWQQTGGPAVVVSNASGPLASFTAPATPAVLTFTLRVTDSKGLADATPDEAIITVTDMPIAGLSAINSSPTQLGNATSLTASISAGTNVTYTWSFGDGSPVSNGASVTHTYAVVGSYTATVTATNSVGVTNTMTLVTIVDVPIGGLNAANSSPTRLTDATLFTATVSAGTNVVYVWSFGDGGVTVTGATATHVYTTAGTFAAVVMATNGAGSVSATTPVTITNLPPVANAGNDQTVSIVGNVNLIGVSSSDPDNHLPLSYLWQQTGGPAATLSNPAAASPTFTAPNTASVLTFTLRVTDSQGLGSVLADEVVINVIDIGISGLGASNSSPTRLTDPTYFTASVTSGTGVTFTWGFGDGSPIVMGTFATHVYTAAGSYAVVLTATNTNGSVNASTVATIVNQPPVADAGSDGQGFAGTLVSLGGGASYDPDGHTPLSYLWQQTGGPAVALSNASAISPSFTAPGVPTVLTFTLTVTDAYGAADATPDEIVVTVLDVPIAGLITQSSSPTTLGQPTLLTASVSTGTNVIYTWNLGDGSPVVTGATVSHVYPSAGLFTPTVTATNGSGGAFGNVLVTVVNLPPVANAGADGSGEVGSSISLNGSASSDPDGHLPLAYGWVQTGGPSVTLSDAAAIAPSFTAPNAAGVLTFSLTVTDARGLADPTPDEVEVTVLDVSVAGLTAQNNGPTTLGQATLLTASVTGGTGVVFTWDFGDGSATETGANVSHVYPNAGEFVATVAASNTSGQASETTTVSVVNQAPVANAGADQTVSVSGTVQLNGTASGDGDGHNPLSYHWAQTGGPSVVLSNPADVSPSFVAPSVPAVLTFTLTVTDARGLADATPDVVVIRVLDIGISGLSATNSGPTTLGQVTTLTATATGSNVIYTWDFGDGVERLLSPTRGDVTVSHTYAAPGNYIAVVTASNGQGSVTAQTLVTVSKKTGVAVYLPLIAK